MTRFPLRDKRLFEISEVEITRVNCNFMRVCHDVLGIKSCMVQFLARLYKSTGRAIALLLALALVLALV